MSDNTGNTGKDDNKQLRTVLRVAGLLAILAIIALRSFYLPSVAPDMTETTKIDGLIAAGRYDEVIETTTRMLRQLPDQGWVLVARGEAYRRKGDLDHAIADLNEAVRLDPASSQALYDRCLALHGQGNLDRALDDCNASTRIKPDFNTQEATAALLLAKGDFDRAYDTLNALIAAPGPEAGLPGIGASLMMAPRFYRGQLALFLYDRPAAAADDLARAADQALMDHATAIDFSLYLPGDSGKRRIPLAFQFMPDGIHLMIWSHIARVRTGQDDSKEFAAHLDMLKAPLQRELIDKASTDNTALAAEQRALSSWPAAIYALFLGKSTPEAIRSAAEADPALRSKRSCEANFYLAEYRLEQNAPDDARRLLQLAADGCPPEQEESRLAKWELKRLKS